MTGTIGRKCPEPRCPKIIPDGQLYRDDCETCQKVKAEKEARAGHKFKNKKSSRLRFYGTSRWQKVRELVLDRDPICTICGRASSTVAHHLKAARENPELRFVLSNLAGVCESCHNRETQRESSEARKRGSQGQK